MVTAGVSREQRFSKSRRCPICGGCDQDPRGKGRRCAGYLSSDGGFAHCMRIEHAGPIRETDAGTYPHKLRGQCDCGLVHRADDREWSGIEAVYQYRYADQRLAFEVVRSSDKRFWQRRPNGAGGWENGRGGIAPILYRLPELVKAPPDQLVYIVEGEKDCDRLRSLGLVATTAPQGAGKWGLVQPCASTVLAGRQVVTIPDDDDAGRAHVLDVSLGLKGVASTIRRVELWPQGQTKRDVSDWLDAGNSVEQLVALAEAAAPADAGGKPVELDPFDAEIAKALEEVQAALSVSSAKKRAPLFTDAADLLTREFSLATWAITGLVTRYGVAVIGGEPKSIKTFVAIAAAVSVATGTKLFGEYYAERGIVAYFFCEDLDRQVRNRVRAELAGAGRTLAPGRLHVCPRGQFIDVLRDDDLAWVIASARALGEPIDVLFLDPLRDLHSGEEDSSDSMREVMRRLRLLGELLRCTVITVHHTAKQSDSTAKRRPGQRLRGSGAIHGSIDAGIYVSEAKGGDGTNLFVSNVVSEVKGAKSAPPFGLELAVQDDENGEAVSSTWRVIKLDGADPAVNHDEAGQLVTEIADVMFKAEGHRATVRALRKNPGGGKLEISAAIRTMERDGLIAPVMNGKRHEGYRLTPAGVRFATPEAPAQEDRRVPD